MTRSRIGLTGMALVALIVTACGSGTPATPGPGVPTPVGQTPVPGVATPTPGGNTGGGIVPCDTLRPQVVAIVGRTLYTGTDLDNTDTDTNCTYTFADAASDLPIGGIVNVRLESATENQIPQLKLAFEAVDQSGIGDAGAWADGVSVLYSYYRGATWAVQLVLASDLPDRQGVATQIMQALFNTM